MMDEFAIDHITDADGDIETTVLTVALNDGAVKTFMFRPTEAQELALKISPGLLTIEDAINYVAENYTPSDVWPR